MEWSDAQTAVPLWVRRADASETPSQAATTGLVAYEPATGKKIGYLDYQTAGHDPLATIAMIRSSPSTVVRVSRPVARLRREQTGARLLLGHDDAEGEALRQSMPEALRGDIPPRAAADIQAVRVLPEHAIADSLTPPKGGKVRKIADRAIPIIDALIAPQPLEKPIPIKATAGKNTMGSFVRTWSEPDVEDHRRLLPDQIRLGGGRPTILS